MAIALAVVSAVDCFGRGRPCVAVEIPLHPWKPICYRALVDQDEPIRDSQGQSGVCRRSVGPIGAPGGLCLPIEARGQPQGPRLQNTVNARSQILCISGALPSTGQPGPVLDTHMWEPWRQEHLDTASDMSEIAAASRTLGYGLRRFVYAGKRRGLWAQCVAGPVASMAQEMEQVGLGATGTSRTSGPKQGTSGFGTNGTWDRNKGTVRPGTNGASGPVRGPQGDARKFTTVAAPTGSSRSSFSWPRNQQARGSIVRLLFKEIQALG